MLTWSHQEEDVSDTYYFVLQALRGSCKKFLPKCRRGMCLSYFGSLEKYSQRESLFLHSISVKKYSQRESLFLHSISVRVVKLKLADRSWRDEQKHCWWPFFYSSCTIIISSKLLRNSKKSLKGICTERRNRKIEKAINTFFHHLVKSNAANFRVTTLKSTGHKRLKVACYVSGTSSGWKR